MAWGGPNSHSWPMRAQRRQDHPPPGARSHLALTRWHATHDTGSRLRRFLGGIFVAWENKSQRTTAPNGGTAPTE